MFSTYSRKLVVTAKHTTKLVLPQIQFHLNKFSDPDQQSPLTIKVAERAYTIARLFPHPTSMPAIANNSLAKR